MKGHQRKSFERLRVLEVLFRRQVITIVGRKGRHIAACTSKEFTALQKQKHLRKF